jgi:imidazolonepropionase-like amidohydrolase
MKTMVDLASQAFAKAVKKGVKISYGTDAGGYAWTESHRSSSIGTTKAWISWTNLGDL